MKLKKSYRGFVIWMFSFLLVETLSVFLPLKDNQLLARVTLGVSVSGIFILTLIIYLTENIFWYSGMSYETAIKAQSAARKLYALRHLRVFGIFTAAYLLFSVMMQLFHLTIWADIIFFTVGIVAASICTMRIHL